MTTLTVGTGQRYTTIAAAVAASASGDTINVNAGTYTNDFLNISHSLTIRGVGGAVNLVATVAPPNGKAIIDEGGAGVSVTLSGLTLSGAKVADGNGAGVRYEGGTLMMDNMTVTGNQEGILGAADSAGSITITNSTFTGNGSGDGYTHNIYVGAIASFTLTNSTVSNAVVGHDVKSRAANNVITGNMITDTSGSASYEIDLPNGGIAVISNNTIEKGANAQNPIAISYGEEGNLYAAGSLKVSDNLIVNDDKVHSTTAVKNATGVAATVSGNTFYGWNSLSSGPAVLTGNTTATTEPALTRPPTTGTTPPVIPPTTPPPTTTPPVTPPVITPPVVTPPVVTPPVVTPPVVTPPVVTTPPGTTTPPASGGTDTIVLNISQDAWKGDAQYTISVDGRQYGGTRTATVAHASGKTQAVSLFGFSAGQHTVTVDFLNDASGGTPATDRNLYVDSIVDNATITKGAALMSGGAQSFIVGTPAKVTVGSGPAKIVLQMAEDAWQGNAQFTVQVDGKQVGGTLTTSALHSAGASQEFDIMGAFTPGPHQVAISFVNDAYGGSAATDRNLYVNQVGGVSVHAALLGNGTQTFTTVLPGR